MHQNLRDPPRKPALHRLPAVHRRNCRVVAHVSRRAHDGNGRTSDARRSNHETARRTGSKVEVTGLNGQTAGMIVFVKALHLAAVLIFVLTVPPQSAQAQPVPGEDAAQIVAQATDAFFTQLVKEDFAAERGFLSDSLATSLSSEQWREMRQQIIAKTGPTPHFRPHKLTFYQQETLLAAVDYAGQTAQADTYICGYILWSFSSENTLGLTRFEQNIIEKKAFEQMGVAQAAQLMTQWQCPPSIIETVLNVTLQTDGQ